MASDMIILDIEEGLMDLGLPLIFEATVQDPYGGQISKKAHITLAWTRPVVRNTTIEVVEEEEEVVTKAALVQLKGSEPSAYIK